MNRIEILMDFASRHPVASAVLAVVVAIGLSAIEPGPWFGR